MHVQAVAAEDDERPRGEVDEDVGRALAGALGDLWTELDAALLAIGG